MSAKTWVMKWMFRMMRLPTCEDVDRFSYDYLEGNLDLQRVVQIERHLKNCKNCRRFMIAYRHLRSLGRAPETIALHSEFREKLAATLMEKGS